MPILFLLVSPQKHLAKRIVPRQHEEDGTPICYHSRILAGKRKAARNKADTPQAHLGDRHYVGAPVADKNTNL